MNAVFLDDALDPVDICYNNVFKAVFIRNTPESRTALSRLVSAVTGRSLTVLSLSANEPPVDRYQGPPNPLRYLLQIRLQGTGEHRNVIETRCI
jgi:hypothetical protein